jgi:hypothetical protein
MKKILLYLLPMLLLVGCTSGIDLTNNATIVEKSQTAEMRTRHAARYFVETKSGNVSEKIYLDANEDWGRVGDVIVFTNRAMMTKTPTTRLED